MEAWVTLSALDATAWGIGVGGLFAFLQGAREWRRARDVQAMDAVLTLLAGVGLVSGIQLVVAGMSGDRDALPSTWRENIAVAGTVMIGLALSHIAAVVRSQPQVRSTSNDGEGR